MVICNQDTCDVLTVSGEVFKSMCFYDRPQFQDTVDVILKDTQTLFGCQGEHPTHEGHISAIFREDTPTFPCLDPWISPWP